MSSDDVDVCASGISGAWTLSMSSGVGVGGVGRVVLLGELSVERLLELRREGVLVFELALICLPTARRRRRVFEPTEPLLPRGVWASLASWPLGHLGRLPRRVAPDPWSGGVDLRRRHSRRRKRRRTSDTTQEPITPLPVARVLTMDTWLPTDRPRGWAPLVVGSTDTNRGARVGVAPMLLLLLLRVCRELPPRVLCLRVRHSRRQCHEGQHQRRPRDRREGDATPQTSPRHVCAPRVPPRASFERGVR